MNRPEIKNKSINDAIVSIKISEDSVLKDLSPILLERDRLDGKLQRESYVAYFSGSTLFGKTVGRRFWQDIESDADSNEYCVWKNAPDPELLRSMKGSIFTVKVINLELCTTYVIEEKDGRSAFETNKYSFVLMENEDLEEMLETILIEKNILNVNLEEILE